MTKMTKMITNQYHHKHEHPNSIVSGVLYFDSDIADDDETIRFGPIRVVVDPSSSMLLQGATLDYKDGVDQSGFSIDNPNAQKTCGCGQSFS